jgi:hypothetical protein
MERWEEFHGGMRRAPRFPLEFPLSYRPVEDSVWYFGRGANISRSGLLFRTSRPLRTQGALEVSFSIPIRVFGQLAATIVCRGRVVRQVPEQGSQDGTIVAATIDTYRFHRREGSRVQ